MEDYAVAPTTADVPLLIEVADSSLAIDRRETIPLYEPAGIPFCWLANIPDRRIEVYSLMAGTVTAPPRFSSRAGPCRS